MLVKNYKDYQELNKKIEKSKPEKTYDLGLLILRPILAYIVVMTHCYNYSYLPIRWKFIYIKTERFAFPVRVFFIMSIYYSYNTLINSDYKKKYERLIRLIIPYILWPIIIFYLNRILRYFIHIETIITVKLLIKQLLIGAPIIGALWYQWVLIFISVLINIIILIFKNSYNFILIQLSIVAFIYQYNGKNQDFIKNYDIDYQRTFGRILEVMTCAFMGFFIASSGIMIFFRKYRLRVFVVCTLVNYFIIKYDVFITNTGAGYAGVKLYIVSICIFFGFAVFPSELVKNKIILKIIKITTNYTAGIYYIHQPLSYYLRNYISDVKKFTFKGCGIIYISCYLISFFGMLIFGKTRLRNLFI